MSDKSQPAEVLEFNLEFQEVPVKIKDESGNVKNYTLREMDGKERDKFLNNMGSRMRIGSDGKPSGIRDFNGMQSGLLTRCLLDEEGKQVSDAVIQGWPAKVQTALFMKAQEMNGLSEGAEAEAKNV